VKSLGFLLKSVS